MKTFKTIEIVRFPLLQVWSVMRDQLPEVACHAEGVERVTLQSREELADNRVRVVNVWKADPSTLRSLGASVAPEMLEWTDYAEWDQAALECHWHIKTHFAPDHIACSGTTSFVEAMAGRGTRVTIAGELVVSSALPAFGSVLAGGLVSGAVEAVASTVLPGRFRAIVQAISHFLKTDTG